MSPGCCSTQSPVGKGKGGRRVALSFPDNHLRHKAGSPRLLRLLQWAGRSFSEAGWVRNARSGRREDHPALLVFRSPACTSAQETGCNHVKLGGRARLRREARLPHVPRPPADAAAHTSGHGRFLEPWRSTPHQPARLPGGSGVWPAPGSQPQEVGLAAAAALCEPAGCGEEPLSSWPGQSARRRGAARRRRVLRTPFVPAHPSRNTASCSRCRC
jgi:hypothetical protein